MKTRIKKWGDVLAVRIPKRFAAELGLAENSPVELRLEQGALVIHTEPDTSLSLKDLLKRVTPENRHGEEWDVWEKG